MHVLTITGESFTTEVHMLNVGETFPRFGGSSSSLVVGENQARGKKTASLILRHNYTNGIQRDEEMDIHSPGFWEWIAKLIEEENCQVEAVIPNKDGR